MRKSNRLIALFIISSFLISGCATVNYPRIYKVDGKEYADFKELDDERALKAVALIYNARHDMSEDSIARNIALDEYMKLLKKRNSAYLKKSGIFDTKYEQVDLKKWGDGELRRLYETLKPRADLYYMDSAVDLTEAQNADRLMYLTSVNAIENELRRRGNTKNATIMAGQILVGVLSLALAMI